MNFTEPMLAASLLSPDVEHTDEIIYEAMKQLKYPVIATLKMDGIRAMRLNGSLLSRTLKEIPNKSIRRRSLIMSGGYDMELFRAGMEYNDIQSVVMSEEHEDSDKIEFHILDRFFPDRPYLGYEQRLWEIFTDVVDNRALSDRVVLQQWIKCNNADELLAFEKKCVAEHGEGICFRLPNSPYKCGRSTLKEQYLVKFARYVRDEAVVVGFAEQMENGNSDKRAATGKMNRSTFGANMYGKNTLGAFIVRNTKGQQFPIGTGVGLTKEKRKYIWEHQSEFLGQTLTYKHKPFGQKELPRSPVMVGWRSCGE